MNYSLVKCKDLFSTDESQINMPVGFSGLLQEVRLYAGRMKVGRNTHPERSVKKYDLCLTLSAV